MKVHHHKEQAKLRLASKWTSVVRSLHHERAPWKGFEVPPYGRVLAMSGAAKPAVNVCLC